MHYLLYITTFNNYIGYYIVYTESITLFKNYYNREKMIDDLIYPFQIFVCLFPFYFRGLTWMTKINHITALCLCRHAACKQSSTCTCVLIKLWGGFPGRCTAQASYNKTLICVLVCVCVSFLEKKKGKKNCVTWDLPLNCHPCLPKNIYIIKRTSKTQFLRKFMNFFYLISYINIW